MNDEAARQGRSADVTPPPQRLAAASAWSKQAQDAFYASVGELMAAARRRAKARAAARLWRAIMLAPALEVCEALLRGETVPGERLDPDWVKRFGVKS